MYPLVALSSAHCEHIQHDETFLAAHALATDCQLSYRPLRKENPHDKEHEVYGLTVQSQRAHIMIQHGSARRQQQERQV